MEPNTEETMYQLYTIIDNPNSFILGNPNLPNYYEISGDDGQDNQVVYIALQQDDDEEEEEEEVISPHSLFKSEVVDDLPQPMSNVKLVTLDNGQVYITTENAADNLTAVEPHLLTNTSDDTTSTDEFQLTPNLDPIDSADENPNYREIQLEDGTCAIINADLWNSLIETAPTEESETNKKKKFPCLYVGCGKSFTTAHHLSVHIRSHTGNRPYPCTADGCSKAFATGYSLKAHLRTHTGEKPYGCNVCLKSFKTSGDLQKHIRTHTGEKPFTCPIEGCGKSFTTSNIRKVHIRSHTGERPYTCKVTDCGKAFASATNYKNHMRIHSGEKPYVCQVEGCAKRFTEYSSLYKHTAVHQPYRHFRCDYCSQYFKFENTLRQHKKSAHNVTVSDTIREYVISKEDSKSLILEFSESSDIKPVSDPLFVMAEEDEIL